VAIGTPLPLDPALASTAATRSSAGWPGVGGDAQPEATGQSVLLSAEDHAWLVVLHPEEVWVTGAGGAATDGGTAEAVVTGSPRTCCCGCGAAVPQDAVVESGDAVAVRLMRERLGCRPRERLLESSLGT